MEAAEALIGAVNSGGFPAYGGLARFNQGIVTEELDPIRLPDHDDHEMMSAWAFKQYTDKYSWKDEAGEPTEVWPDTAYRVVRHVLGALNYTDQDPEFKALVKLIAQRKFIPGGRYLAQAGRQIHQVNNCFLYRCEDSRDGWAELLRKAVQGLSSGGGIGVVYSDVRPNGTKIKKTGGIATGPLSPANMVNEVARHVMQGGHRRSAVWAGLHWNHADVFDWIHCKDWSDAVRKAKEDDPHAHAEMDMTNISVILDSEFFFAFENPDHPQYEVARAVYFEAVANMIRSGEPGFSIDTGENAKENLRNAPVTGDTHVLTVEGYRRVQEIVDRPVSIFTGSRWAHEVVFNQTGDEVPTVMVKMTGGRTIQCDPAHEFLVEHWIGAGERRQLDAIVRVPASDLKSGDQLHVALPSDQAHEEVFDDEAYTLGFIYGDGSFTYAGGAELTLCTAESKACGESMSGMRSWTKEDRRGYTRIYFSSGDRYQGRSKSVFPDDVYDMEIDSICSFVAGLFDADGNWEPTQKRIRLASKHRPFLRGVARSLEQLGILAHISKAGTSTYGKSQGYQLVIASESMAKFAAVIPTQRLQPNLDGYQPYRREYIKVEAVEESARADVFCADVGVPEHSFVAEGVVISNCTEITSEDDSDVCNLGSINLSRIHTIKELAEVTRLATLFLVAGTVYSDVPHDEVRRVREKNRRLGLGLMGVHEWLLQRGYRYEMNEEFHRWLAYWVEANDAAAIEWAGKHNLSVPIKKRAIAPNGTIGIVGETTTSAEPVFCVAYIRRFIDTDKQHKYQYVIDPAAHRLIEEGVKPEAIEDAYSLAYDVERRIKFQYELQKYVDHAISSTINLPYPIEDEREVQDFAATLYKYLPGLRGVTCYPNGARAHQPLEAVPYELALGKTGVTFEGDPEHACKGGACGV